MWALYRDPRSPKSFKVGAWGLFSSLVMPVDLVPDFIPVLGQLDDRLVVFLGLKLLTRLRPPELVAEYRERFRD